MAHKRIHSTNRPIVWLAIAISLIILSGCITVAGTPVGPTPAPVETAVETTAAPVEMEMEGDPTQAPPATPTPTATLVVEPSPIVTVAEAISCEPTEPDMLGPFYVPGAPERSSVGQGHLLSGIIRSSEDCAVLPGAQLEFWLAGPDGDYADDYRATMYADETGAYSFESPAPPPYSGRPPHIHLRVTADGYEPLVTQYYPAGGQTEGQFDLVLRPDPVSAMPQEEAGEPVVAAGQALPAPTLFDTAWADRSVFEPGLIESKRGVLAELPGATVYHLDLKIAENMVNLTGSEEVLYTNREEVPLDAIYFRLFPNLADGSTTITALSVNGDSVEPIYELENSAMQVPLSPALAPGEQVVIRLEFAVEVPASEGGNYGTFAFLNGVLALAHAYPMIAVYDDEGWNVEIAPSIGDVIYADSSFYLVRVTAPAGQTLVASGLEIDRQESDGQQIVTFAAGPVRDFYLAASDRYQVTSQTAGEITVNSYAPAELSAGSETVLAQAVRAIASFNDHFGPYPFTEFDLVSTTTFALGIEYPGIVAILVDLYEPDANPQLTESVVAHEVAHQWFYSVVGNDQVDEPWIDEAMAQYATLLYFQDVYGSAGAQGFRGSLERRWERVNGSDKPIGLPVRAYTPQEYSSIVYGRGPLFLEALAERMGEESFSEFLKDYYQTYQWDIASSEGFQESAEEHCQCDLSALFDSWVYETPPNQ